MNVEIEAKMQLNDPGATEQRLIECGAKFIAEIFETNTYFDDHQGTLKRLDRGLRLRVEKSTNGPNQTTITHKGPRTQGQLKSRHETDLAIHSARDGAELLSALGFLPLLNFEKKRRRWELDRCHVDMDRLPYLGDYVEIEGPTDESVLAVREKLRLAHVPLIAESYVGLLKEYAREHQIDANAITFDRQDDGTTEIGQ